MNYHPFLNLDKEDTFPIPRMTGSELTSVTVFSPSRNTVREQIIWSIENEYSFPEILTTHRVANLLTKEFLNFKSPYDAFPSINTYYRLNPFTIDAAYSLSLGKRGSRGDFPASKLQGEIAEVLLYDRVLSDGELRQVNTYCSIKYGIPMQGLPYSEYYNSENRLVWNGKEFPEFRFNTTGLGRDDGLGLYQKQATSAYIPNLLNVGLNKIVVFNADNEGQLPDNTFLLWADDGRDLQVDHVFPHHLGRKIARNWLFHGYNFTKNTAKLDVQLNELRLDIEHKENEILWLMIDRSGQKTFDSDSTEFIAFNIDQSSLTKMRSFSGVSFDTDGSGEDVFSFCYGPALLPLVWLKPSRCRTDTLGHIITGVEGGEPPFSFRLYNSSNDLIKEWSSNRNSRQRVNDLDAGRYILTVTDARGIDQKQEFFLPSEDSPSQSLASEIALSSLPKGKLDLSRFLSFKPESQHWYGPSNFYSQERSIFPTQRGTYHALFKVENGCTQQYTFHIVEEATEAIEEVILSPNPSSNGGFLLRLKLANVGAVKLQVVTVDSRIIHSGTASGDNYYEFRERVPTPGTYYIQVIVDGESRSLPFIYAN